MTSLLLICVGRFLLSQCRHLHLLQDGWTLLHLAAVTGYVAVAKVLIREGGVNIRETTGYDDTDENLTAIYLAANEGHASMVKFLASVSRESVNQAVHIRVSSQTVANVLQ